MRKIVKGIVIFIGITILFLIYIGNTYYMGSRYIAHCRGRYELIWGDPYDGLSTSLGYCINFKIDSLKSVKWNEKMIVVEQNINKKNRWAVIKPKSDKDTVLYDNIDSIIRNLTEYQIDSIIKHYKADNFTVEELKPSFIKRCYE